LGIEEAVEGAGGMPGGDGTGGTTVPMSCAAGGTCSDGASCLGSQCCQPPAAGGVCNLPACGCSLSQVCYPDTMATGLACFSSTGARAGQDCRDGVCVIGLGCF